MPGKWAADADFNQKLIGWQSANWLAKSLRGVVALLPLSLGFVAPVSIEMKKYFTFRDGKPVTENGFSLLFLL